MLPPRSGPRRPVRPLVPAPLIPTPSPTRLDRLETTLLDLVDRLVPAPMTRPRGRSPILPAALLWSALLVGQLHGDPSHTAVWRRVTRAGLGRWPPVAISDDAVYQRLRRAGPATMATLFADATAELLAATPPDAGTTALAPFATDIVALDASTLDKTARLLPALRGLPKGDRHLLPGRFVGLFDVRRQLWRDVRLTPDPFQHETRLAPELVATLAPGTLVLADLGFFGFPWADALTDAGLFWVSRLKTTTSVVELHVLSEDPVTGTRDVLAFLGKHRADRAAHAVRLLEVRRGDQFHRYATNVLDPDQLPMAQAVALYGRRWDIELAIKTVKRDLGLHLLWSARWETVAIQVWGVLLIAQLAMGLRRQVAAAAAVDDFDVSLTLLLRDLPEIAASGVAGDDLVGWFAREGRRLKYIRPSRRIAWAVPALPPWTPPPPDLALWRAPRYAGKGRPPAP